MQTSKQKEQLSSLELTSQQSRNLLIGIILISVVLRVLVAIYLGNQVEILPGTHDQISYHTLANRFINGHGLTFGERWWPITAPDSPTAHWSYLYTFYLIVVYKIFGPNPLAARIIQAIIVGILQPYLVYKIGKHLFNNLIGIISAGITAIYIYFIYYAGNLMTEAFYISAILGSLYLAMLLVLAHKKDSTKHRIYLALSLGIVLGMGVLFRQLLMLFVPFLFLWVWWSGRKQGGKSTLPMLLIAGIVIVAAIVPFTIYNYARFERFVLLNTNAGYAFFWGNHPIYGTQFESILPPEMGTYEELIPKELHHLDEAALDQELLKRGLQFITDDPGRYVLLSLSRIPPYFKFWPSSQSTLTSNFSRVLSFGLAWPFMLYGFFRAPFLKESRYRFGFASPVFLLYTFIIIYTAIHILTWTLIRYRLPVDAILVIFASIPIYELIKFFKNRKLGKVEAN